MRLTALVSALVPLVLMATPALAVDARSLTGVWEGGYDCWHGKTFVRLTLTGDADGDLKGTWRFGQTSYEGVVQQPVPDGEFEVHGWLQDDGAVHLSAGDWILQPPGWEKFGVIADLVETPSDRRIGGYILHPACGRFAVFKK